MDQPAEPDVGGEPPSGWSRRTAISHIARIWVALNLAAALAVGARLLLARTYGSAGLGIFATVLAAVTLMGRFATFGVHHMWLDVHGSEGRGASRWRMAAAGLVVVAMLPAIAAGTLWATLSLSPTAREVALLLMPLVLVHALSELVGAQCQVSNRFRALAFVRVVPGLSRFLSVWIGVIAGLGLIAMARLISLVAVGVAVAAAMLLFALSRPDGHVPTDARPRVGDAFRLSWPYAISGLMYLVYFQIDILLINGLKDDAQTGLYAAAASIVAFVYLLPNAVYRQFLAPRFHRWAVNDPGRLRAVHRRGTRVMIAIGLGAGIVTAIAGPFALSIGFGKDFDEAVPALLILSIAIPIRFWSASARLVMATRAKIKAKAGQQALTAAVNVILNLALIPPYGIEGAAVATLISESLLLWLVLRSSEEYLAAEPSHSLV